MNFILIIYNLLIAKANACTVCFGGIDPADAMAINIGILSLLLLIVAILGGFAAFFIYLKRRAKTVSEGNSIVVTNHKTEEIRGVFSCMI